MYGNNPSICVFLDLAKAFDTACHKQLLDALEDIGIRGTTLKLMESYLLDRKQYVMINDVSSDEK